MRCSKRPAIVLGLLTAAFLPRPLAAQAVPDSTATATTLRELETRWLHARDSAVVAPILAPDFLHPVAGGYLLTRADQLRWVASHPHPPSQVASFERIRIRVYDRVAIVNGIVRSQDTPGAPVIRTQFTDVFVLRDGAWRAVNAQETPIDGR
jgi:hypothetical protein